MNGWVIGWMNGWIVELMVNVWMNEYMRGWLWLIKFLISGEWTLSRS